MKLIKKYYNFINSASYHEIQDVGYIAFLSVFFKVVIYCVPLRWYYNYFFNHQELQVEIMQPYRQKISQIKRFINILPWKSSCLIESLIIQTLIRRFGLILPVELGIAVKEGFRAHAWSVESCRRGYSKLQIK